MRHLSFSLDPTPPFRLDLTVWAIRRRPENLIDRWDGETYTRVLVAGGRPVLTRIAQSGGVDAPRLEIAASAPYLPSVTRSVLTTALNRLLGVRADLREFYGLAAEHPRLHELTSRFRGLKPPRFPSVWEGVVNGIACQQLSLAVGILLLNRLAAQCGLSSGRDDGRAFPRPQDLSSLMPNSLRSLGFSGAKSHALIQLAGQISSGQLDLESLSDLGNEDAISRLLDLPGVGRWTAEYVLLRGLGRVDVFPGDDIGARNNLARWLKLRKPLDYARVARVLRHWKPYAGLIYFHLLLDGLERAGRLRADTTGTAAGRARVA